MRAQAELPAVTDFDRGMASRYRLFRCQYVSENQQEAADLLGIHQTTISNMESGRKRIGDKGTKTMIQKYRLNTKWLVSGIGPDRLPEKKAEPESTSKTITQMKTQIDATEARSVMVERQMYIISRNEENFTNKIKAAIKLIDKQNDYIGKLEQKIAAMDSKINFLESHYAQVLAALEKQSGDQ